MSLTLEGEQKTFCADCYERIKEEYGKKKSCDDCPHFGDGSCELRGKLIPVSIGYRDYFLQAENCAYYAHEKIESGQKKIQYLGKAGKAKQGKNQVNLKMLLIAIVLLSAGVFLAYSESTGWFSHAPSNPEPEFDVGMYVLSFCLIGLGFAFIVVTLEDAGMLPT